MDGATVFGAVRAAGCTGCVAPIGAEVLSYMYGTGLVCAGVSIMYAPT